MRCRGRIWSISKPLLVSQSNDTEDEHGQPRSDEDYETMRYVRLVKGQPRIFANKDDVPSHETGEELTENDLQASDWYVVESV
jgi:hypothetical protein